MNFAMPPEDRDWVYQFILAIVIITMFVSFLVWCVVSH